MSINNELSYLPAHTSTLPNGSWLVIAPHPDDETFGMGGILLLAKEQNITVDLIVMTDGAQGGKNKNNLVQIREHESQKVAKQLGIRQLHFWHEPDRGLQPSEHLIQRLANFIQQTQATSVFFPSPSEPHPDHRSCAVITWESLRITNFSATPISYEISVQGPTNCLIDISDVINHKQSLMANYSSQVTENIYIERIIALNKARTWSLTQSVSYAESFYYWPKKNQSLNVLLLDLSSQASCIQALPKSLPFVSVITRTQNRPDFLRTAIRSVAVQSYSSIELIVINDGGTDCQQLVQEEVSNSIKKHQYHYVKKQKGRAYAANAGLKLAQGEFIIFLDDDDWFLPDHIESLVNILLTDNGAIASYNNTACVKWENGHWQTLFEFKEPFDKERLAYENYIPIHAILFRRTLIDNGLRFIESMQLYEDWAFWLKASQQGSFIHNNHLGAMYRVGTNSGIGLPGTEQSFAVEYQHFIQWVKNNWDYEQALSLIRHSISYKNLLSEFHQLEEQQKILTINYQSTQEKLNTAQNSIIHNQKYIKKLSQETQKHLSEKNKLLASTSWKLTAPLRKIIHPLKSKIAQLYLYFKIAKTLVTQGNINELLQIIIRRLGYKKLKKTLDKNKAKHEELIYKKKFISIVTTEHTLYVAHLIQYELAHTEFKTEIITKLDPDHFGHHLYIIICPQMFDSLPVYYIAFQMEQSVNPRWFNSHYFNKLEKAQAILDYSLVNIDYLQQNGMSYKTIFYTPISLLADYPHYLAQKNIKITKTNPEYDVIFYGDANNTRRQQFIKKISQHFKVKIISQVFGSELYQELQTAKIIINIHYYDNALLETTRIYECLSLGLNIISESSTDITEHKELHDLVHFTPIDDIDAMLQAIDSQLQQTDQQIRQRILIKEKLSQQTPFGYFFNRFLLAQGLINYQHFQQRTQNYTNLIKQSGTCLSLPETNHRRQAFIKYNHNKYQLFNGLRHHLGWIGCALSYKNMIYRAKTQQLKYIIICEDDVEFYPKFEQHLEAIQSYLAQTSHPWHIFSGLIANLHTETRISHSEIFQGLEFIHLNKMTSMIFNIYHHSIFDTILQWDETNTDDQTNTIDRFLENQTNLKVITSMPFLVGHHEERNSTLWGISNSVYSKLIKESEILLAQKLAEFKSLAKIHES